MKRDTNVTRKTGQKQPYFTPFCTVELILKPHIEILDNLWYQTILLGYLIGLRANLIVMGNWKSLYCPSAWLFSNYVNKKPAEAGRRKRKLRVLTITPAREAQTRKNFGKYILVTFVD